MTFKKRLITVLSCQPLWRVVLAMSIIAVLYLATTSQTYPVPASANDKVNHFIAFLELTLLAFLAWPGARVLYVASPMLLFGLLIELVQSLLPYREFSLFDVAADASGILAGVISWHLLLRKPVLSNSTD
ncbi:MAG: VanZ family protein [Marinobacter sp.]|uniref:VanZ family protein n=1 Tax=Marinobacter sp. TaxID=50741 RepID=UPI0034A0894A